MATELPSNRSWSLVDLAAGAAVLLAAVGVLWSPKLSGAVDRATGALQPVTVSVDVRGVPSANAANLIRQAQEEGKVAIVIRNSPHGKVKIKQVQPWSGVFRSSRPTAAWLAPPIPTRGTLAPLMPASFWKPRDARPAAGLFLATRPSKLAPQSSWKELITASTARSPI